jgi:hypothetical protein
MTDMPEFIVESIDTSDETWKFFNNIQDLNNKDIQNLNGGIVKKFTSLATNATIFRWKFGDQPGNPAIETTVNPYIHIYHHQGTYNVSHQSCYPCLSTSSLVCSNGWCTKSIEVEKEHEEERESGSIIGLFGFAGLLFIAKEDNCCRLRERCTEERAICTNIKHTDTKNVKACRTIEKTCTTRLKDCKEKCIKMEHVWDSSSYKCSEKDKLHRELCQTIEQKKRHKTKNSKGDNEKDKRHY